MLHTKNLYTIWKQKLRFLSVYYAQISMYESIVKIPWSARKNSNETTGAKAIHTYTR